VRDALLREVRTLRAAFSRSVVLLACAGLALSGAPAMGQVGASPDPTVYAGKRLAISVVERCASKPSVATFLLDTDEDDCGPNTLAAIRAKIVSDFAGRGVFASVGDGNGDLVLTVTLTKKKVDSSGPFGDFTAKYRMAADYALTNSTGVSLASGAVSLDAGATDSDASLEQHFADKLAATVLGQGATGAASPQLSPLEQQTNAAANAALLDLVAKAYRSLATKPPLPDDARAEKLKAEAALQSGDTAAAGHAYMAALNAAFWWPEGHRELALLLAKLNKPADAIVDMNDYLELAPDAPDAAQMREKIADWSRLAPPPPPPPAAITMLPGTRGLGTIIIDTPSIIAQAMNRPDLEGALVVFVMSGSPAERAGLAQGDVVVAYNGHPVNGGAGLRVFIKGEVPGATAQLSVLRGQQQLSLTIHY